MHLTLMGAFFKLYYAPLYIVYILLRTVYLYMKDVQTASLVCPLCRTNPMVN